ncbi:uncharacterized protein [Miscanthus floridulus]|uniref:uncharacterized protein n=1 Tax=Miscanthus floridulus TaxID=154761 RepID=UPI003458C3AF
MASVAPPPCLGRWCGTCSSSGRIRDSASDASVNRRSNYFVYLWFYTAPHRLFHICCHCSSNCIMPKIINVLVVRNDLKIGKGKIAAQLQVCPRSDSAHVLQTMKKMTISTLEMHMLCTCFGHDKELPVCC